ncbi:MAG TPA: hypothetical protein VF828_03180 [Patescibacteria group bacterium]
MGQVDTNNQLYSGVKVGQEATLPQRKKETMAEVTERLKNFQLQVLSHREGYLGLQPVAMDIFGFQDVDKNAGVERTTYISRTYPAQSQDLIDWFAENSVKGIKNSEISETQKERWLYCHDVLKLPILACDQLTFNEPERDLKEFFWPGKEGEKIEGKQPMVICVYGESGEGKSTMAAALALKENAEIANFDIFSQKSSKEYLKMMREAGLNKESSTKEICSYIHEHREEIASVDLPTEQTFFEAAHEFTNMFSGGYRPELVICDFPGYEAIRDSQTGRPLDLFDIAAYQSMSSIELIRNRNFPFEESIQAYLNQWRKELKQMKDAVGLAEDFAAKYIENPDYLATAANADYFLGS